MKMEFIEIDSILVDTVIFETAYTCDVKGYRCNSTCCYRGCIVRPSEVKRVEKHLPDILSYLSPENQEAIRKNGSFVAKCNLQCPGGCDLHPEEAKAVNRFFRKIEHIRCTLLFNNECIFVYRNNESMKYCAIHSYAIDNKMNVEDFKYIDCIQYPLMVYRRNGKKILTLQKNPRLSHIPCLNDKRGEPLYKGFQDVVELLLGNRFNRKLQACGRRYKSDNH